MLFKKIELINYQMYQIYIPANEYDNKSLLEVHVICIIIKKNEINLDS